MKYALLFVFLTTLPADTITYSFSGTDQNSGQALSGTIVLGPDGAVQSADVEFLDLQFTQVFWQGDCINQTSFGPCVSEINLRSGSDHLLYLQTLSPTFSTGPLCSVSNACWDWNPVTGQKDGRWASEEIDVAENTHHFLQEGFVVDPPPAQAPPPSAEVPEPSSLVLTASALVLLLYLGRVNSAVKLSR